MEQSDKKRQNLTDAITEVDDNLNIMSIVVEGVMALLSEFKYEDDACGVICCFANLKKSIDNLTGLKLEIRDT